MMMMISAAGGRLDPKSWDSIIHYQTKQKDDEGVLKSYSEMECLGVVPDPRSLPLVLKACARLGDVETGKNIHYRHITNNNNIRIRTGLIDMYCKCGFPEEARLVFEDTTSSDKDVVCWNAMICGYAGAPGYEEAAISLFNKMMMNHHLPPTCVTLVGLLLACGELLELRLGQEIHCYCLKSGPRRFFTPHLGTALITFYSKFSTHASTSSRFVFDSMPITTPVSWNAIMSSYFNLGDAFQALTLFRLMLLTTSLPPNPIALLLSIQSCTTHYHLHLGKQIHQLVIKLNLSSHLFILNALIQMYAHNHNLHSSILLFQTIPIRGDVALWNTIMSLFRDVASHHKLFALYHTMLLNAYTPDSTTIAILLSAITDSGNHLTIGQALHAHVIKNHMKMDFSLGNALIAMYAHFNSLETAFTIFHQITAPNVISWNTLILALARCKFMLPLRDLFQQMQNSTVIPNSFTMLALLAACRDKLCLNMGRSIHGYVVRHYLQLNLSLCTGLTDMYMNCGDETSGKYLFETFPNKDVVFWNALITYYVDNNRHNEAMLLFYRMLNVVEPNSVTIINILSSCAYLANLPLSRCIHAYAVRREFARSSNTSLGNALVTMYARCGSLCDAGRVFQSLVRKDVISWNAMISAYGLHGCGKLALIAFSQMKKEGLSPTSVTFVSILSACSHAGLILEGWEHFYSMTRDYNIVPEVVHYACMVDLLGRGGLLDEARKFINLMPIEPDASVWRALLGACRVYSNTELAKAVFQKLVELEPMNVGNYILVSNIYASEGLWKEVKNLRSELKNKNLRKPPGKSWIFIRGHVHKFIAGDTSHPLSNKIYTKLRLLVSLITENGYVPDRRWVLQDVKEEEKDERLFSHSEKLAIAFGVLSTRDRRTPIIINKNLRVCGDCHTFSKHVSKCVGREIVLRDATRFHHFINGLCSCNDYW